MELREYQKIAHARLTNALTVYGKALLKAPTGSGKTITGLKTVIDLSSAKGLKRVAWVAHQTALANQSLNAIREHFGAAQVGSNGMILDGVVYDFMPWQGLRNKADLANYDVLVVDEYHQGASGEDTSHKSFTKIILASKIKYQLYVTATPNNLDPKLTKGLLRQDGSLNPKYCAQISLADLEKINAVCNVSLVMVQTADTLKLKRMEATEEESDALTGSNPDLVSGIRERMVSTSDEASKAALRASITDTLIQHYYSQEIAPKGGQIPPTIMFASVIGEGSKDADQRSAKAIEAKLKKYLNGKVKLGPNDIRCDFGGDKNNTQMAFRAGEFPIMIVVRKAREGFDYPALEVAVDFCPSVSKRGETSQVQKLGRVIRPFEGKEEARYYVPDAVNFHITQRGVRQDFVPAFPETLFSNAKGLDLVSDVELAKELIVDAHTSAFALRQLESGEDNAEVVMAPCEVVEASYSPIDDTESDLAIDAVRKVVRSSCKVYSVKAAYSISAAYNANTPNVQRFSLFDKGLCERGEGARDSEGKKAELIAMARRGEARPTQKTSLGQALCSYACPSHNSYDPDFTIEIKALAPKWFEDIKAIKQAKLLEMARRGEARPTQKTTLGSAVMCYTCPTRGSYDPDFTIEIKALAPKWFEGTVALKQVELIAMARRGEARPTQKTSLGQALCSYTNPSNYMYAPDFTQKLRALRPEWFIAGDKRRKTIKANKRVKNGKKK